ncbi:MAG: ABC transporter permease [bacterium]
MKIAELFSVAFSSLRSNKLRSSLTMLGIIVGIFSIISISTVISMLQTSIEEGVSALGKNTFQIQKFPMFSASHSEWMKLMRNRKDITLEEYYSLKDKLVEAKSVGAEQWQGGKILKFGNKETNPNIAICGMTPEAFPTNNFTVEDGREFSHRDVDSYANVIVLGKDITKVLFPTINPIGQEIWFDGHRATIIGVLESQGQVFGQSQDNFALVPITTFQSYYGKRSNSINITVMAYDRDSYESLMEVAEGYFRTIRKVPAGEDNDFTIRTNQAVLDQINSITSGVRIGSYVIAAIALLAAGIGIMNIMLVSVTERTREIGIRKAIGAKKINILVQFLIEAVTLCLLGGIVGLVLGILAGNFAGSLLEATALIPIDWIIIGISLCVIIGVTFGTYPAYKAANLDPIEALRYE